MDALWWLSPSSAAPSALPEHSLRTAKQQEIIFVPLACLGMNVAEVVHYQYHVV